jgi:WD40 repeat protein
MESADFGQAISHFEKVVGLEHHGGVGQGLEQARDLARKSAGQCLRTFGEYTRNVRSVVFVRNGCFALSANDDKTLRLWDVSTGKCVRTYEGHTGVVSCIACFQNGQFALTGSHDGTLRLWEIATNKCVLTFDGSLDSVLTVAISPDDALALSGSFKGIHLWEVATGKCLRTFQCPEGGVKSVAFSPDGRYAVSGHFTPFFSKNKEATLRLWNLSTGECLHTFEDQIEAVTSVAFSPDGRLVISGDKASFDPSSNGKSGNLIKLWDPNTGKCLRTLGWVGGSDGVIESIACSPNGRFVLSGRWKGIQLWDITTGQCLHSVAEHENMSTSSVAFSPDGRLAISGGYYPGGLEKDTKDDTLQLWEVGSVMERYYMPPWFYSKAVTIDEVVKRERLHDAYLSDARESLETGRLNGALECLKQARAIPGFEKNPQSLELQARVGARARIESYGGGWLKSTFDEGLGFIHSVAYSPCGGFALSGGDDKMLSLWDIRTGKCVRSFKGHIGAVLSVAFSPDGYFALSGGSPHIGGGCYGENRLNNMQEAHGWLVEASKLAPTVVSPEMIEEYGTVINKLAKMAGV